MRKAVVLSLSMLVAGCAGEDERNFVGSGGSPIGGNAGQGASGGSGGLGGSAGQIIGVSGAAGKGAGEPVSSLELERVWYIASQKANSLIDFNQTPPKVTCGAPAGESDGFEGTGVFTDPKTGKLLFYTDGRKVFHGGTHQLLANGSALSGDASATEPALIAPKYGSNDKQFYIFTNSTNVSAPSTISYSVMDLSQGSNGSVVTKNTQLFSGNPGEGLDVLPHPDGKSFWILAYDSAAKLQAYLITDKGVSSKPILSSTTINGQVKRGAINHTLDYDTIVMAINFGGRQWNHRDR